MAKFGEITGRQQRMIVALMTRRNIGDACAEAKVSRSTLSRWLTSPVFRGELVFAEGRVIGEATRQLLLGQEEAINTLRELMTGATNENVRRQASNDWLALLGRYRELNTIEERLSRLEKRNEQGNYSQS
jgi:hypothetical protein